jgi:tRNA pseudouridine55 synthase
MYSAVKIQGVPLYKAARAGRTVDRPARAFTVHSLQILSVEPRVPVAPSNATGDGPSPAIDVTFDVVCSKGTYVRTLCADIGEALGVGGHLAGLERRRVGRFGIEEAMTLDELAELAERQTVGTRLHSLAAALEGVPVLTVDQIAAEGVHHGVAVPTTRVVEMEGAWAAGACVRLQASDGRLLAIGKVPCGPEDLRQAAPGTVITLEKVLA